MCCDGSNADLDELVAVVVGSQRRFAFAGLALKAPPPTGHLILSHLRLSPPGVLFLVRFATPRRQDRDRHTGVLAAWLRGVLV